MSTESLKGASVRCRRRNDFIPVPVPDSRLITAVLFSFSLHFASICPRGLFIGECLWCFLLLAVVVLRKGYPMRRWSPLVSVSRLEVPQMGYWSQGYLLVASCQLQDTIWYTNDLSTSGDQTKCIDWTSWSSLNPAIVFLSFIHCSNVWQYYTNRDICQIYYVFVWPGHKSTTHRIVFLFLIVDRVKVSS